MVKIIPSIILFLLLSAAPVSAQPVSAKAYSDMTDYQVGDYIYFTIEVSHNKFAKLYLPEIKDSLASLEIIKIDEPYKEEKNGSATTFFRYTFSKYDSSHVTIPPLQIKYSSSKDSIVDSILTNPVGLSVHTLKVNTNAEIKDVKSPMKIPFDWKLLLLFFLIAIAVIGISIYVYLIYRNKKLRRLGIFKIEYKQPHETALFALEELDKKQLWQKGYVKEYHTEITRIIREYFEARFNIPALEQTTSEILLLLEGDEEGTTVSNVAKNFLNNADMVKFAKFSPMDEINKEMMQQAINIVETTVPKLTSAEKTGAVHV